MSSVSIELRQLTRLRTTLEVASATALQPGPAGLLVYANARNSRASGARGLAARQGVRAPVPARGRELLAFAGVPDRAARPVDRLAARVGAVGGGLGRLPGADPGRSRAAPARESRCGTAARTRARAGAGAGDDGPGRDACVRRRRAASSSVASFPATAGAYVLRASIRTAAIDLAFFLVLACIVLLISIR